MMPERQLEAHVQLRRAVLALVEAAADHADDWAGTTWDEMEHWQRSAAADVAEHVLEAAGLFDLIEWQRQVLATINGTTTSQVMEAAEPFDFDIGALFDRLRGYRTEHAHLKRQLATPPPGWSVFGAHAGQKNLDGSDIVLEFWGDEGGVPIWERVRTGR